MSFPKLLVVFGGGLLGVIALAAMIKGWLNSPESPVRNHTSLVALEVALEESPQGDSQGDPQEAKGGPSEEKRGRVTFTSLSPALNPARPDAPLPEANRIQEFFTRTGQKFPIVTTITYKSRVPWQKGRPAWLSDYAAHYATSRHFIARSLNGKPDYFKQDVSEGDRFNVFNPDKRFHFHLLVDTSRCKMWFYYTDLDTNEKVLIKTYQVGLGRIDSTKPSGLLTPHGKYTLGDKIAIYKPKLMGYHNGKKVELIRIYGTRWIPFDKEIGESTASPEGFGIQGVPSILNEAGELVENNDSIGKYESDGCVRLASQDMEELFAIIITKPTTIELVRDFYEASGLAEEKAF